MKKILLPAVFYFLVMVHSALAVPVFENVSIQPSSLWLGESTYISLNCSDSENKLITQVYANIVRPDIILPTQYFNYYNGYWVKTIDKNYLYKTGNYNVEIFCINNISNSSSTSASFQVSKLTGYINQINPEPAYVGDVIEIAFIVKKNNVDVYSNVTFNVSLNSQLKNLIMDPPYEVGKGWILKINSPSTSGTYNLGITAFYDRVNATYSDTIEIRSEIEFDIISIDKSWVNYDDNIVLKIRAKDKGNVITLNENNLNIKISSVDVDITSIEQSGGDFNIKFSAPNIAPGNYELKATLDYKGHFYSDTTTISYIVPVKGKILDSDNKGIWTQLIFSLNGVEKLKLTTDSGGSYAGSLPPDTYDVKIIFPDSTVYLEDCIVNNFDDPIKYFYSSSFDVPGIKNAGLHSYEIALTFSKATMEMKYDERKVTDETQLKVFKCSNWNSGIRACNGNWEEFNGQIDTVRNLMKIDVTSLSAFIIGTRKTLLADFNLDKEEYYLGSEARLSGIIKDIDSNAVENATVELIIKNEGVYSTITDKNGIFSLEFFSPESEGNYTIFLNVKRYPYLDYSAKRNLEVVSSKNIYISFPDTIKVKRGENLTQEFSLRNTGQTNLYDLRLSLSGIPSSYYNVTSEIERLKMDEERKLLIDFFIPSDAEIKTSSVSLTISNDNIYEEKIFGFTVEEESKPTASTTATTTGFVILPQISTEIIYIVIFAIFCFSSAVILKKVKIRRSKTNRGEIRRFLFDVKGYLKRKDEKVQRSKTIEEENYDDLISSVFPRAFKKYIRLVGD